MANEHGKIGFYAYEPRGIIPLDERFTIRKSLRSILKKKNYEIRFDTAPLEVLRACSRMDDNVPTEERWLSEELIEMYMELFKMGRMHTLEVWTSPPAPLLGKERGVIPLSLPRRGVRGEVRLIGGLYGLTFGAAFCGESMFSRAPYASQVALVHLVERLRLKGFQLLDAQMPSEHLHQFGMYECSNEEYLTLFHAAETIDVKW